MGTPVASGWTEKAVGIMEWSSMTNIRKLGGSTLLVCSVVACVTSESGKCWRTASACVLSKTFLRISRGFKDMADTEADELGT